MRSTMVEGTVIRGLNNMQLGCAQTRPYVTHCNNNRTDDLELSKLYSNLQEYFT